MLPFYISTTTTLPFLKYTLSNYNLLSPKEEQSVIHKSIIEIIISIFVHTKICTSFLQEVKVAIQKECYAGDCYEGNMLCRRCALFVMSIHDEDLLRSKCKILTTT